jgi:glycosyltransferase involved in cell wall biosynthesis
MNNMLKVSLIIPVYNEREYLRLLLEQTKNYIPPEDTVIVDDGSEDGGTEGLESEGYLVLHHQRNFGKGEALKSGFRVVCEKEYDWVLTMDADGQHSPASILDFMNKAKEGGWGIIIGNRRKSLKQMPWDRKFSNLSTSYLLSLLSGQKIWDAQCGFRMYKMEFLQKMEFKTYNYDTETELLLQAFCRKIKIAWIDIPTIYGNHKSHIHRIKDTLRFIKLIFKYLRGQIL